MDGKQFLVTACLLRREGLDEADFRSAISRAYYACFITTRDIVLSACRDKIRIKKAENIGHEKLQQYLKNGSSSAVQQLGSDLASLHGNRVDADYIMYRKITVDDAQDAIGNAEVFLKDLSIISNDDIGKALENYLKIIYP